MIIAALAIFQTWILVGVSIGKFLNVLVVRNIVDKKLHGLGAYKCLSVSLHYSSGLNAVWSEKCT